MFINTFNVFFPHAIIFLSCKFPMLQLRFLYNIRCNSNRIIYNVTISSSFQFPSQFPSQSLANNTFPSPLHYFPLVSDRWFGEGVRLVRSSVEAFFSFFSLPIQFILLTFAAVKQLAMTYQVNEVLQRIIRFFASFCTLSLVNPNNLLTHTHTHTMRT